MHRETSDERVTVRANAFHLPIATGSIQCCITSPPYFGKVGYGDDDSEHGRHALTDYIDEMVTMALEVHRVTDDQAVFWLNVGDTMANSGGSGGDYSKGGRKHGKRKVKQGKTGIAGAQHALVPQRIAIALQETGMWQVKRVVVWDKTPNVIPEDVRHVRRPLSAHETILMLVKGKGYRYRPDQQQRRDMPSGDVWNFKPVTTKTGHPAPFPEELPRRCILLSTKAGDRVLDPYVGSGTTTRVANRMGRVGVGADLYMGVESD